MKGIFTYICLFLIISVGGAQTRDELEKQKQKAVEEIELTRQLINQTEEKRIKSVNQVRIIEKGIQSREKLIRTIESEIDLMNQQINEIQKRIEELSARETRYRHEYATIIYFAYKNHTEYEKLMYLLASNTISQAYQRYKYLKYITDYRKKVINEINNLIEELAKQKEKLGLLKDEKINLLEEKEKENKNLSRERAQRRTLINGLQQEEKRLREEIKEKERIKEKLENEIRRIIEEEAKKLNSNNLFNALTPEQRLVSAEFVKNKGLLPWPVERGIITTPYGDTEYPGLSGTNFDNNGVDISSMPRSKARAVFEGEVTKIFAILGANYTVLIRHGEYLSVYQNLVNVRVKTGDKVKTKQVIGDIYTDENKDVSMIHFEIWKEKNILNPEEWLSK